MSLMTTGLPLAPELSDSGTEMMTPLPVPIHSRWRLIIIDVMRTNENPNFPVPFLIRFSINTKFQFESNSIKYNTEHFGNVRFNINILKVTEIMSMEESNRRIQSDRNPDSIASCRNNILIIIYYITINNIL